MNKDVVKYEKWDAPAQSGQLVIGLYLFNTERQTLYDLSADFRNNADKVTAATGLRPSDSTESKLTAQLPPNYRMVLFPIGHTKDGSMRLVLAAQEPSAVAEIEALCRRSVAEHLLKKGSSSKWKLFVDNKR